MANCWKGNIREGTNGVRIEENGHNRKSVITMLIKMVKILNYLNVHEWEKLMRDTHRVHQFKGIYVAIKNVGYSPGWCGSVD